VRRLAAPTVLIACAATLVAAPTAAAKLQLPPGADAPPVLPAGVVVAESPKLATDAGQGALMATAARSKTNDQAGGKAEGKAGGRPFWATVNICDTQKSPNALGVRASVPGNGSRQRIFARYTAQWWSGAKQEWLTVGGSGITKWIFVGDADMSSRQSGWTFHFVQPPQGKTYVLRGVVELQWRGHVRQARKHRAQRQQLRKARKHRRAQSSRGRNRKRKRRAHTAVVRQRTLLTKTGVKNVQGGDPAGLSKAMCLIW
jgi:hypothetical protein